MIGHHIASFALAIVCLLAKPAISQCEINKLTASDGEVGESFGWRVAISNQYATVGALWESTYGTCAGAAYIFEPGEAGWSEVAKIFGSDIAAYDVFGVSIAISGDTALVGAPWNNSGAPRPGTVYGFDRIGSNWVQAAKLVASDASDGQFFGVSVAIEGNVAVIGAHGDGGWRGAAYVFQRIGSIWSEVAKLTSSDGGAFDRFGTSVGLSGGFAIIGAPRHAGLRGAAYLFDQTIGWTQVAKLVPSNVHVGDRAGQAVALANGIAVLGAPGDDTIDDDAGAVIVFENNGSGWIETEKLLAGDGRNLDALGVSVAAYDDTIVVGTEDGSEAAYIFGRNSGEWTFQTKLRAAELDGEDNVGWSVAIHDRLVLVGAPGDDDGGTGYGAGAAYLFGIPTFTNAYCFGTFCPCLNDDAVAGCDNSAPETFNIPKGGLLSACGTNAVASDDLVLTVSQLPANQFGIVFMGSGQQQTPYGDGFLCISAGGLGIFRFNPPQNSGSGGMITLGPGIVARSQSFSVNGHIDAGETWNFQGWYRDPMGPCGSGFNFSNALAVTFAP